MKSKRNVDFEELGLAAMRDTRNEAHARAICMLQVMALADELQPEVSSLIARSEETRLRARALQSQLYNRLHPVSDAVMIARSIAFWVLVALFAIVSFGSFITHTTTMQFFGLTLPVSIVMGLILTGAATAAGHQAFEYALRDRPVLQGTIAVVAFLLVIWGLWQLGQARGLLSSLLVTQQEENNISFVDDDLPTELAPATTDDKQESIAQKVRDLLGNANIKIMLAADAMVGLLLALIVSLRTDPDFAAWHRLAKATKKISMLEKARDELLTLIEIARKQVLAGIIRGKNYERPDPPPYLLVPAALLATFVGSPVPAFAQSEIHRHEAILLDTSGSISKGGMKGALFAEYLHVTKNLLRTAPPNTRIWAILISTESFGSVETLVRGWTPQVSGVFTDDLQRARRQLVESFESKSAQLSPIASGTDIIGGLWRAKTIIESGSQPITSSGIAKEIRILSDMINETRMFMMPALLSSGPDKMLEVAKANNLVVPLDGYRVYVSGAATTGLTPPAWNAMKAFWTLYFREAGAVLLMYSSEASMLRSSTR